MSQQMRTLPDRGGAANKYERLQVFVGGTPVSQRAYYDAAGNLVALDLYGDMNCDGVVDYSDVDAFVLAISDPVAYAATYPNCQIILGDVNGDGLVDYGDVDIFIALLSLQLPQTRRFAYDEENRLTAVTDWNDSALLELRYDALGRRVQTVDYTETRTPCGTAVSPLVTRHVYDGLSTVAEYMNCGTPIAPNWTLAREFVWGASFTEPLSLIDYTTLGDNANLGQAEVLHYVHDGLGSVVALSDAGNPGAQPPVPPKLVERYDYDPYGHTYVEDQNGVRRAAGDSKYGNPLAWTGQRYDAGVKLYGFFARTYSPELGRWLQRDPAGYRGGVNLYQYVRSMPTRLTDPLGLLEDEGGEGGWGGPPFGGEGGSGGGAPPPPDPDGPEPEPCPGGGILGGEGEFGPPPGPDEFDKLVAEWQRRFLNSLDPSTLPTNELVWLWLDAFFASLSDNIESWQEAYQRFLDAYAAWLAARQGAGGTDCIFEWEWLLPSDLPRTGWEEMSTNTAPPTLRVYADTSSWHGHAFVELTNGNQSTTVGFYPPDPENGKTYGPFTGTGQFLDDSHHHYDTIAVYTIDAIRYERAMAYINAAKSSPADWSLISWNCADFVYAVASRAGVDLPGRTPVVGAFGGNSPLGLANGLEHTGQGERHRK